jgi:hypothetical protein
MANGRDIASILAGIGGGVAGGVQQQQQSRQQLLDALTRMTIGQRLQQEDPLRKFQLQQAQERAPLELELLGKKVATTGRGPARLTEREKFISQLRNQVIKFANTRSAISMQLPSSEEVSGFAGRVASQFGITPNELLFPTGVQPSDTFTEAPSPEDIAFIKSHQFPKKELLVTEADTLAPPEVAPGREPLPFQDKITEEALRKEKQKRKSTRKPRKVRQAEVIGGLFK